MDVSLRLSTRMSLLINTDTHVGVSSILYAKQIGTMLSECCPMYSYYSIALMIECIRTAFLGNHHKNCLAIRARYNEFIFYKCINLDPRSQLYHTRFHVITKCINIIIIIIKLHENETVGFQRHSL